MKAKEVISSSSKDPVCGVKGASALMLLPDFDLIRGTSIDYMHCVLLGVTKNLMTLWFDPSHKNKSFSVHNIFYPWNRQTTLLELHDLSEETLDIEKHLNFDHFYYTTLSLSWSIFNPVYNSSIFIFYRMLFIYFFGQASMTKTSFLLNVTYFFLFTILIKSTRGAIWPSTFIR